MTSTEHFDLGHRTDTPKIDSAKYGLDDLDKVHAANRALDRWRQKIRHRRDNEFSLIRNAIVRQLKLERILSDEVDGRPGEILVKLKSIDLSTKPPGRKVDSWNISAWNIIVQGKGTKDAYKEAFAKWCEEKGISEGSSDRYDKKAFKMAMKRAEDRWGWNLVEKVTKTST